MWFWSSFMDLLINYQIVIVASSIYFLIHWEIERIHWGEHVYLWQGARLNFTYLPVRSVMPWGFLGKGEIRCLEKWISWWQSESLANLSLKSSMILDKLSKTTILGLDNSTQGKEIEKHLFMRNWTLVKNCPTPFLQPGWGHRAAGRRLTWFGELPYPVVLPLKVVNW